MTEPNEPSQPLRRHSLTGGLIVLGVGLFFLLANLEVIPPVRKSWPIILIIVGIALVLARLRR